MARKNNKGFSVVEIVIAITILSLLLIPIVNQIGQTYKTNRQTKRQQLANDNAIYIMEDFQKSTLDELDTRYGSAVESPVTCLVYDEAGLYLTSVTYNAKLYNISSVELGHDNTSYARSVILDDLSSSLLDKGYRLTTSSLEVTGFEINDEGNTVQIDSNGFIVGAVCESVTAVSNPNEINLGNMQNMDSTKVAIIGGNATNFDAQAESGFYSLAMNKLKEEDLESWEQAMYQSSSDSVLNQYYNLDNTIKVTRIYIDENTVGDHYYQVSVDVTYKNTSVTDLHPETKLVNGVSKQVPRWSDELAYNVYSQKFYTDECPAVYFEYQPYTAEASYYGNGSSSNNLIYSANDYIIVENYVQDAKIYLYKPYNDQMNVYSGTFDADSQEYNGLAGYEAVTEPVLDASGAQVIDEYGNPVVKIIEDYYVFYRNKSKTSTVTIHVGSEAGNGYITKPATIFTNIWLNEFNTDAFNGGNLPNYILTKQNADGSHSAGSCINFDGSIKKLSEDERYLARLFTIRVYLTPDDTGANIVSLTGAKGEN